MFGTNVAYALQIALWWQNHARRARHRFDDDRSNGFRIVQAQHAVFQLIGPFSAISRQTFGEGIAFDVQGVTQVIHKWQQVVKGFAVTADATHRSATEVHTMIAFFTTNEFDATVFTTGSVVSQGNFQ